MPNAPDDISSAESREQPVGEFSIASDHAGSRTTARQILKVLRNPRDVAALFNAQLRIRGKARLSLSVRLVGRIHFRADGDVEFGQGVTLVGDVVLDRNEHGIEQREVAPPAAPVIIEDHAWIGSHTIVLPGVCIGRHAAVGAGSVVTRDIPANCLAVGNPARVVRQLDGLST